jgi:hypothetical protein
MPHRIGSQHSMWLGSLLMEKHRHLPPIPQLQSQLRRGKNKPVGAVGAPTAPTTTSGVAATAGAAIMPASASMAGFVSVSGTAAGYESPDVVDSAADAADPASQLRAGRPAVASKRAAANSNLNPASRALAKLETFAAPGRR